MRSGQESYAQAQKGMPLPSLPGESLARQIPARGVKQVGPALPSTRLASLRAYGAPVGSQSLPLVDRPALDEARLPARLRRSGRLASLWLLHLPPAYSKPSARRPQVPDPGPSAARAGHEQGASRARARREQARRARAHNVARMRCAASPRALCARRACGTTRCARQLRRARAPPVQAIWPGQPNG